MTAFFIPSDFINSCIIIYFAGVKVLYIILGSISLGLGILGIFLPLLPTTPFLLLTAALYFKGSPNLYKWLISHPRLGTYIRNYRENKAITIKTKIVSISMLWITILICIFFVIDTWWVHIILACVLIGVTIHILRFKTLRTDMDNIRFKPVTASEDIEKVAALADEIWREYYGQLLESSQIDYMLELYQSPRAITEAIGKDHYEYYLIDAGGAHVGYIGIQPGEGKLFLSKIYILRSERGKGDARKAFGFLEKLCSERGLCSIWLTVNRYNDHSVAAYRKSGFEVIEERVTDIGNGYVMDDFIMERIIA